MEKERYISHASLEFPYRTAIDVIYEGFEKYFARERRLSTRIRRLNFVLHARVVIIRYAAAIETYFVNSHH